MKNITYSIILSALITIAITSCKPDKYEPENISLTPVYSITDIVYESGKKIPIFAVDIYREKTFLFCWSASTSVKSYKVLDYEDKSTDTQFIINIKVSENIEIAEDSNTQQEETINYIFDLTGDKQTNIGKMTYTKYENSRPLVSTYTIKIKESQKYN